MNDRLLPANDTHRKIIHLDMDAFYASVEHRDHPELSEKALVVGHDPRQNGGHGVVATADYLSRSYGVHSAMPTAQAVKLVPREKLVFVEPDFNKYQAVSHRVHQFMHEVTDKIEPISLDEAYLDVTQPKKEFASAVAIGNYLQEKIFHQLHLTCSFGVSYNKFLAKMGSEYAKPFGKTVISPEEAPAFLAKKDIAAFPGIGQHTQQLLRQMGINSGQDLQESSPEFLIKKFKRLGYLIAMHSRGIDLSPVKYVRQAKSLGKERTFVPHIYAAARAQQVLQKYSQALAENLQQKGLTTSCVVLKIRDPEFHTATKRRKLAKASSDSALIWQVGKELLSEESEFLVRGIRLLGLTVTDLEPRNYQAIDLFEQQEEEKWTQVLQIF